nr:tho complex subunit 4a [Quercus suber]
MIWYCLGFGHDFFQFVIRGTAEIVFSRLGDAVVAVKKYNNVQLDGKPMKIEIVGVNIATPTAANGTVGNLNGIPRG